MGVLEIIGGIIILLCAVVIVVTVLSQEGSRNGMNALSGASNESSYLGKNKNRSLQATMVRISKVSGIVFVVATLAVYLITAAINK